MFCHLIKHGYKRKRYINSLHTTKETKYVIRIMSCLNTVLFPYILVRFYSYASLKSPDWIKLCLVIYIK